MDHDQLSEGIDVISTAKMGDLVDARWIAEHAGDASVRVVEVDVSAAIYNQGHIPGAVLWNAYTDLRDGQYRTVPPGVFEMVLARSGISPDSTIVFYGYGALLGFWLMKAYGHQDVRILNGNRDEWGKHPGQWSEAVPTPTPTVYPLPAENSGLLAARQDVEAAINDPNSTILDVRAESEYRGERFWPSGATADTGRAGRIPGAVHAPIDRVRAESGDLKGTDELRALYAQAGISPEQRVIIYCTIGNRASLAWFILTYLLGYPHVSVYQGSYVEWGKLSDTAVETG
ncbi:MAG TPA: rhodanese-like domain-containing protein [Candidatus Dormibacteraeota bacterium]|nr:rhodanese-like domain-containing protein [Candidatus Dormibacteraeota bacterium]